MVNPFKAAGQAMDMQKKMKELQKQLQKQTIEVSNNSVTVVMNGEQKIVSITINPLALETGKKDILEKAIISATNEAQEKIQKIAVDEMSKITGGLNIPGLTT
jgi:hypothetical protein